MAVVTVEIGLGLRGKVRSELERVRFLGHDISWYEGRGIITQTWTIKGDAYAIERIRQWLVHLSIHLNEASANP